MKRTASVIVVLATLIALLLQTSAGSQLLGAASSQGTAGSAGALFYGPAAPLNLNGSVSSMVATPDGKGYWLVGTDGGVFNFGDAGFYGSLASLHLNQPIVAMDSTPDGKGYWLIGTDGGVFNFGDAGFYGSLGSLQLASPIVGMSSTPDGKGYWLVGADGGVFALGDATFYGSVASLHLSEPVVGMAATPSGKGYWLVAADGGVFAVGNAKFFGSGASLHLSRPVVGMAATPNGKGYWLVAADGGVFAVGNAKFHGSGASLHLSRPIVSMATSPDDSGYWLVASDGTVVARASSVATDVKKPVTAGTKPSTTTTTRPQTPNTTPVTIPTTTVPPTPSTVPVAPPLPPLPILGVNLSAVRFPGQWWQSSLGMFAAAGATWIRADVNWSSVEPSPGVLSPGVLAQMDLVVSTASSHGVSVLFVVVGTPAWAQPADRTGADASGGNLPPADDSTFAWVMAALAARYSADRVAWELWNEPNLKQSYSSADPVSYTHLACAAYAAIKAAAPGALVAAGALSGQGFTWLSQAYAAGLHGCFDVLSIHPYDAVNGTEPTDWQPPVAAGSDHQLMVANGDGAKPIWLTEFGWYADPIPTNAVPPGGVTLAEQATYTANFIRTVGAAYPYVTQVFIYNGVDAVSNGTPGIRYAGVLDGNLNPKPVYWAIAHLYGH